ncbi:MAG: hypothetical protein JWN03_6282 [Nocardia sp.]|uniref:hypothetical protein n=1 Tax=Nocardia sp. TaxID=1821 RepID=UPI00261B834E|nr:hypothetical protein [Nocardia sp.]MCU1646007.1 hypothetical protein [Nocardia sp.]
MIFEIGSYMVVVPFPRFHAGWFVGLFSAVLVFGVIVMLVVATSCGDHISTEPGPGAGTAPTMALDCAPFCGTSPSAPPVPAAS